VIAEGEVTMLRTIALLFAVLLATPANAAPPVSEGTATAADGTRIHYRVAGQGSDVVLAPFALYHAGSLDALANGNRRIVTYDPRSRGKSERVPLDRVSIDHLLSDLDAVRRAVGAERVAIIGWSGGGMETFVYALRNPNRVTRLVQLAPIGPRAEPYGSAMFADRQARTDAAAAAQLEARTKAGAYKDRDAELCRDQAKVDLPPLLADPAKVTLLPDVCVFENEWAKNLYPYFGALFKSIDGFDWRADMPKVTIPRLVVHGDKDNIPLAASEEWTRGQANARLVIVKEAGHFPHYEQPAETLKAIATFLDGGWPPNAVALK
jgi:pimeloyl-ACP methyl ester carboxylesterase